MTSYNESVRQILLDVQVFLNETLKNEKISEKAKTKKNNIADAIHRLQEEYTALKADDKHKADDESVFTTSSVNSEEDNQYAENKIVDVSVAALKNPIKTGYLEKRRKGMMVISGYQRRYCVVCEAVLYYFEKPTDKKQKGAFHLNGYEFRPAPHLVKDATKKDLSFELVGPGKRTYEFLAENEDEFYSWKQTVEECHDKPIDEEIYEFIEEKTPIKNRKDDYSEDSETYEQPCVDVESPPKLPDTRKLPSISTPRTPLPPVPSSSIPEVPPPMQRRDLPAVPKTPLPALPTEAKKRVAKLDLPKIDPKEDYENMYYSKWNCASDGDNELELKKGDIIHILSKDFDQEKWWVGELKGSIGLVPKDYLAKAYEVGP